MLIKPGGFIQVDVDLGEKNLIIPLNVPVDFDISFISLSVTESPNASYLTYSIVRNKVLFPHSVDSKD
jgi:hypothetical protein